MTKMTAMASEEVRLGGMEARPGHHLQSPLSSAVLNPAAFAGRFL